MMPGQKIARTENRRDRNPIGLARQRKMIYYIKNSECKEAVSLRGDCFFLCLERQGI